MGVDKRSRYFAGGRHSTPGRADAFVLQVRIAGDGQLAQNGAVMNGCDHFERSELWIGTVDIVAADNHVLQPFLPPQVGDVASEFIIAWGAGDVRFSGEDVMLAAFFVRGGNGFELDFDLSFVRGGCGSEAEDGSLGVNREARAKQDKIQTEQQDSQVLLLQFCRELPRRVQRRFAEVEVHSALLAPKAIWVYRSPSADQAWNHLAPDADSAPRRGSRVCRSCSSQCSRLEVRAVQCHPCRI